jgi:menaquinol-cytochrome c reductase iron-sulfur subunit
MMTDIDNSDRLKKPSLITGRRTFLGWFVGVGTVSVAGLLSVPLIRYALDPLTRTATQTAWSDLGPESDFGEVSVPQKRTVNITQIDGWRKVISEKSIYVLKDADGKLKVMTAICSHLGCSVKWNDAGHQFKCPCHNGMFTAEGKLVSGPPPRDLDELDSRVVDGHLQVRYQSFRQLIKTKEVLA